MHLAAEGHPRGVQGVLVTAQGVPRFTAMVFASQQWKQEAVEHRRTRLLMPLFLVFPHRTPGVQGSMGQVYGDRQATPAEMQEELQRFGRSHRLQIFGCATNVCQWAAKETPYVRLLALLPPTTSSLTCMWQQRSLCL